jgi:hypothetical protein
MYWEQLPVTAGEIRANSQCWTLGKRVNGRSRGAGDAGLEDLWDNDHSSFQTQDRHNKNDD